MAIAFAFAVLIALVVSGGDASHHPRHVHISLGVSPSEMIVTWSTSNHDDNAEVKYGKDEGEMKDRSQAIREKLVNGGSHQYVYHAVMTHLNPNAKYCKNTFACYTDVQHAIVALIASIYFETKFIKFCLKKFTNLLL